MIIIYYLLNIDMSYVNMNNVQRQLPDNIKIADLSITDDIISNSTGNVTIDTTGNVVINATSNLVVKSNSSNELHFGYENLYGGQGGGEWKIVNTDANSNIHLVTTDSNGAQNNVMVADSYGRVGIGTTPNSSSYALDVYGGFKGTSSSGDNEFRVIDDHIKMEFTGSNCVFQKEGTNDTKIYNNGGGYLSLGASSSTDHMVIKNNGHVGIGTTSPSSKFHVQQDIPNNPSSRDSSFDDYSQVTISSISTVNSSNMRLKLGAWHGSNPCGYIQTIENWDSARNLSLQPKGGKVGIGTTSPSQKLEVSGNVLANNVSVSSDDRLKENEQIILNASDTIMNLKPQVYDKKPDFNNSNVETWIRESGLIAQEVYYDAPELRHLVTPGSNASNIDVQISSSDDPSVDPDYSNWGDLPASLNYTGFIPYLIKMNQEQQSTINELKSRIEALENP